MLGIGRNHIRGAWWVGASRRPGGVPTCRTMRNRQASSERVARYRRGLASEWVAAAALMARGYRILVRRARTPYGEIDLIAVRGSRIAFVEVKRRATRAQAEAALTPRQGGRIARAAAFWVSRHQAYRDHEQGLDAVLVLPWRLPVHLPNVLAGMPLIQRLAR